MELLRDWFLENKRDLPWREECTPYQVWISEVMLQQTRASVVIEYFNRWMERFPTVWSLASAKEEEVIKLWEGLGYYARARNLHHGARFVVERFGGEIPSSEKELLLIKGIGPYTVGAIRSFAFQQKAAALDGNVMRVLSRFLGFDKDVVTYKKDLSEKLVALLPDEAPHVVMEALIELGALVCTKSPKCIECPLQGSCKAYLENTVHLLPMKKKRPPIKHLHRAVLCILCEERVLLRKNSQGEIMADLWEFPYVSCDEEPIASQIWKGFSKRNGLNLKFYAPLTSVVHHFTRYKCFLYPSVMTADKHVDVSEYNWVKYEDLGKIPLSSGHKKIMNTLIATLKLGG